MSCLKERKTFDAILSWNFASRTIGCPACLGLVRGKDYGLALQFVQVLEGAERGRHVHTSEMLPMP